MTVVETSGPASYVQRTMWAVAQRSRGAPLNVMILPWRIQGPLQISVLEAAIGDVIARHPTLRSQLKLDAGRLMQVVAPAEPVTLPPISVNGASEMTRLKAATEILRDEGRQALDLISGPPIRLRLLRLGEVDHVLCLFVHHAMCDGWSSQIIMRDLVAFYGARADGRTLDLPRLTQQYTDFAAWQIRTYESGGFSEEINYWRNELAHLSRPVGFPGIAPRKGNRDWRAESPFLVEPPELLATLKEFARQRRGSLFSILLSGLAVLLHHHTGIDDLAIGVSTVNRRSKEEMQVVGCVTNLLPARIRMVQSLHFAELVTQVHATIRRLLAYGRIPLELILRELQGSLSVGPAFPIWCQLREPVSTMVLEANGLSVTPFLVDRAAILCDLEADLIEFERGLHVVFAHRACLFDAPTVTALLDDFSAILRFVVREPGVLIGDLFERACKA